MKIKDFIKRFFCWHKCVTTRALNPNKELELYCVKCCKRKKIKQ